jgi:triosephosphate isomerase (TIM)
LLSPLRGFLLLLFPFLGRLAVFRAIGIRPTADRAGYNPCGDLSNLFRSVGLQIILSSEKQAERPACRSWPGIRIQNMRLHSSRGVIAMRRFLVAGNWKMNTTRAAGMALGSAIASAVPAEEPGVEVLLCPPFPYLCHVGESVSESAARLGAQDVYFEDSGAFTGEVAVSMLIDCGCQYVILGHSERRHVMGESDETINRKVKAALKGGLMVVLCVGELLTQREAGATENVLNTQMAGGLDGVSQEDASRIVIAYEPVWAIGTGVTATPEQAESAHGHLRKWVSDRYTAAFSEQIRILYGGSVKPDNAETLLGQANVDGALVGGASLKADMFVPIIDAARKLST